MQPNVTSLKIKNMDKKSKIRLILMIAISIICLSIVFITECNRRLTVSKFINSEEWIEYQKSLTDTSSIIIE